MSGSHPLDAPIWNALTSRQIGLSEGGPLARRYPPAIAPFAAMSDTTAENFAALAGLMSRSDQAVLFTLEPIAAPPAFKLYLVESGEQMIGAVEDPPLRDAEIVRLGGNDAAEMVALTRLTNPGPFTMRTHELGTFLGIRANGQLVAMAGERMKLANFTEITAVCVHPDYRGRGYAQMLLGAVSRQIVARGEQPFLHVFSKNAAAIALYRRQGMEIRRRLYITVLARSD
jgi:ribosomal protein S18 acetylase RimI-like enzyme